MPYVTAGRERLYYEKAGRGPRLLLVRGLSRSMRFWEPFIPHLAGDFTTLAYDHRGIGRSPIVEGRFSIADLADDAAALLRVTGFGRAHILGISLGGMVAQEIALRHPDLVDKLILCATTPGGTVRHFPRLGTLAYLSLAGALPPALGCQLMAPRLIGPATRRRMAEIATGWASHLHKEPTDGRVVFQQALAGAIHNTCHRLREIRAETLIITGNRDRLIPAHNSFRLAAMIPSSSLRVIDGAGHELSSDVPAALAHHVRHFLYGGEHTLTAARARRALVGSAV